MKGRDPPAEEVGLRAMVRASVWRVRGEGRGGRATRRGALGVRRGGGIEGGGRKDLVRWEEWEWTAKDLRSTNQIAQAHHGQFLGLFSCIFFRFFGLATIPVFFRYYSRRPSNLRRTCLAERGRWG